MNIINYLKMVNQYSFFVMVLILKLLVIVKSISSNKPNIIFFLVDDLGMSDIGYTSISKQIPTPFINKLANHKGSIQLHKYYTHSLCTPSRASLLSGRSPWNCGLTYVIIPGSPSGLDDSIQTLPQVLEKEGWINYMVGKWHLGHSREKFTPTHKGFHHFTGMYTWDICPFTKRSYLFPPILGGRNYFDWLRVSKNERPEYYTDSNHATVAITKASTDYIDQHVKYNSSQPLFLYVSYTAGHSPLIPIQEDEEKCKHIKHLWRRQFCGLVVGVDESVERIHAHAKLKLDKNNTIIIFTSDNGGSSWFGGLNYPFRGSKNTPYEGGVRVPAFLVDHRNDSLSRSYNKLFHVSDWFPTILSLCAVKYDSNSNLNLDGKDHSIALYNQLEKDVRTEVLIDLRVSNFSTFSKDTFAYIDGKYKLIIGEVEDSSYYLEPIVDRMNIEGLGLRSKILSYVLENVIRAGEFAIGTSEFDSLRIVLTHYFKHIIESYFRLSDLELVQLYNLDEDPKESINLARQYPDIVDAITNKIQHIMHNNKTLIQNPKLQYSLKFWPLTFIKGDCSKNSYIKKNDNCLFTVPWINDTDVNPPSEDFEIFLRNKVLSTFMNVIIFFSAVSGTIVVIIMSTMWLILHFRKKTQS